LSNASNLNDPLASNMNNLISMKQKFLASLFIGLFILATNHNVRAQSNTPPPAVEIPGTQLLKFTSSVVSQEYQLFIHLPKTYMKDTGKAYPVVYLLDAQYDFPFFTGVYGGQYYDGFLPEFITVGITWGGKDPDVPTLRARDFSPTHIEQMPQSGGGPKFLAFIKNELIPFIGSTYRVTDDRTLIGSSFGGLFTLYTLFNDPSLFHRYVLTSPSLGWDNAILSTYEKKYEENGSPTPVRLFMGIGELEGNVSEFQQFSERLKAKKVKGLEFATLVMKNTGHSGTKPEGYARGLQYVFERPSLQLTPAVLNKYSGVYQFEKDTVYLSNEKGKLIATAGGYKIPLDALTEKDFYRKGMFLNVHFKMDDAGKVTGFQLDQFDSEIFMKKVK
jgi:predicted alpha/beta superfamily hydrolase